MINVCFYGEEMNRLFSRILFFRIRNAVSAIEKYGRKARMVWRVEY